jgi:type I restriction enzyme S subunit
LGTFENIKFPFPTVEKQKQISSILSDLDNKIELLSNQNNTIEELAKVLFQEKFIINVFEEWEEVTLDSVCLKINSGGTPSTKFNEYYKGDINWYSTKELNDNYLFSSTSKLSEKALNESSAKLFPINTVVIAIYAAPTVGRLGILATEAAFNQAACGFVVNEEKICFEYLYLHLLLLRQKLNDMASGTAQQNLNVGLIKNFKILLPPNEIMTSFKELIRPMFQKIKENSEQIIKLTELRDFLIPKLLSQDLITQ